MESCDNCGKTIVFGGVRESGLIFCKQKCQENSNLLKVSRKIPQDVINEQAREIHRGLCPKCQGYGPVDVHTSYRIYSLLLFSTWKSIPNICCRSCGRKSQIGNGMFSFLCGWWGFPWGILITPLQLMRNIIGVLKSPDETSPSETLVNLVRVSMASNVIRVQRGDLT